MSKTDDMSTLTELLCQAGTVMEWPMLTLHQAGAILSGGSLFTRFEVARSESYCGQDVENELARVGVAVTGRGFVPGSKEYPHGLLTFHVKTSQRRWCEYILLRAGFNVVTVVDARNVTWAERHDGPIPAWSGKVSKMGTVATRVEKAPTSPSMKGELKRGKLVQLLDWLLEG